MAAVRTMMSVVREEAAVLTAEVTSAARAGGIAQVDGAAAAVRTEMGNPLVVRQAVEAVVMKEGETSILSQHLSVSRALGVGGPSGSALPLPAIESALPRTALQGAQTESKSLIARTIEEETGVTLREAINNAGQTGVEETVDDLPVGDVLRELTSKAEGEMTAQ